ncbi:tektin-1 [Schistocerca cancellata]|uniref:tektin-1 n=1 Tax=Schistocerca cancellata TaxID=274614 RepID=UPI002118E5AD|nr:tektin-1 [Schistocerca cancellata]XP_049786943.1 tektin-1 [Schistocerca cancellata]XP_049786944.1 tektin-1 [Schistocerca cancellata]XP_049786945.1 tektin-1 [Schistocerca cancellata]
MLKHHTLATLPCQQLHFTLSEWIQNNKLLNKSADYHQDLAERILSEGSRAREVTAHTTKANKKEVDIKLKERITDIQFHKKELEKQKEQCCKEEELLKMYKERVLCTMESLIQQALSIVKKCIILRGNRLGIDLVHDAVENSLYKEAQTIENAHKLLHNTLEQTNEQLRLLRSTKYFIEHDHRDKAAALIVDDHCSNLKETRLNLTFYQGKAQLDVSNITEEEWALFTTGNIERASKEIKNSYSLRSGIDMILKKINEELWELYYDTNHIFQQRIRETRDAKIKFENQLKETVQKANEMIRNITQIEKEITNKEAFLALAQKRILNRTQRPNIELCRDEVEIKLLAETEDLKDSITWLEQARSEAQASMRFLLKTQLQLEEEINIKTNTLKIDEVECMTLRQSMDYPIH